MKKIFLLTAALALIVVASSESKAINKINKTITKEPTWEKSKEGTWVGMHKTWYKLNTKDVTIWMSKDGKKWDMVKDGMWQDKEGKWLKIANMKLMWSADGGKTWGEVPEWKWEGVDGTWNKFDKDWSLWIAKM